MKKLVSFMLACCFLAVAAVPAFAAPKYEDGDWQFWTDATFKGAINDKFAVYGEQEFKFGDGMSQYYYEHTQLQLDFKTLEWLTISPAYREVFEMNSKEVWYPEHQPQLNLTGKWTIFEDWTFEARVRGEYRMFGEAGKKDVWRNRDKFTLKSPWKWTPLKLNPYIADEIFIQEDKDGIYRNRLYVGMGMQFHKNIKGDLYYMWQTEDKTSYWLDYNVLGFKLKCEF